MALVLTYTNKVKEALKAPARLGIDVLMLGCIAGLLTALVMMCHHVGSPRKQALTIDLHFRALPLYTFYSLTRGFVAYALSLVFTLIYGTIAAHNRLAEKFMIPVLDVLQSLPVLTLLPIIEVAMVRLFPATWLGLELTCVIMIFTAQAWNMTFSYHGSVRSIPVALREAAEIQHLSGWQIFRFLELPASMIGLVWNSMMSMAGGWFIITVNEAFTIGPDSYQLPGLGSYMYNAQANWDFPAMAAGVIAMIVMIVCVDQLFWRPIVVWSERFKLEDTASIEIPRSWFLQIFKHSIVLRWLQRGLQFWHQRRLSRSVAAQPIVDNPAASNSLSSRAGLLGRLVDALKWLIVLALAGMAVWGMLALIHLLIHLPIKDTADTKGWIAVLWALLSSFARVAAALLIGAIWTVPAGVLIGLSPRWSSRLQPFIQIVASFPSPMIFPIVTLVLLAMKVPFSIACVGLILLGTQWYTLFNVIAGAMAIPGELREAGRVYHMSSWQRWTRLYIPAVFPYLLTGLITAAGGAWNTTIVAEILSVPHRARETTTYVAYGLGYMITDSQAAGNNSLLAASAVTLALFVILVNRFVWKRVYRFAEERFTLNT
jgi:NitT/TauT family transport system permease protein